MKLWVDDVRDAPDSTWHVCRTVTEAIRAIYMFGFANISTISLDHDISHYNVDAVFDEDGVRSNYNGKVTHVRCDETFEPVAIHIAVTVNAERWVRGFDADGEYTYKAPAVILHTSNPDGAEKMRMILADAGIEAQIAPFHERQVHP